MASILDSFKDIVTERLSFLKIFILTIPTYYSYSLFTQSKDDFSNFSFWAIITLFFVFGFLIKVTGNIINDKGIILPSLNPLKLAFSSFKGIIGFGPIALVCSLLISYICSFINWIPWLNITLKTILWLMASSIMIVSFLMFSNSEKIIDAYKFKVIFYKAGDLIATIMFFIVQLFFLNFVTSGFLGYIVYLLFGFSPIFDFFITYAIIFNIAIFGHYWGQIHHELLSVDNPN